MAPSKPIFSGQPWFVNPENPPRYTYITKQQALAEYGQDGRIDVVLVKANAAELSACLRRFCLPEIEDHPIPAANVDILVVYFGRVGTGSRKLSVGVIKQPEIGAFSQAGVVTKAIENLRPRAIISIGVGWGNNSIQHDGKLARLGDVMVAKTIVEFTVNAKVGPDGSFYSRSEVPATGKLLAARFDAFAQPGQWRFPRPDDGLLCRVLMGKMATGGLLLNNEAFVHKLTEGLGFSDIIGGEMEAWGLYKAVEWAETETGVAFQWIVVKGICDWGFGKESDWQPFAAAAACDLVHSVLSAPDALPALQFDRNRQLLCISSRTKNLVGRGDKVAEIVRKLKKGSRQAFIFGGPGEGKSTVAMEVGLRLWKDGDLPGGAFEINMTLNGRGVKAGRIQDHILNQLLPLMQVPQGSSTSHPFGAWGALLGTLRIRDERFLVVFTNSEDAQHDDVTRQEFLSCLEDLRRLPSSFTIVTSRIKLVMGPDCAPYLLDKLDLAPAMELLVLTAGPGIKWGDMQLDDLAGICGCNAFALVIIGSFLNMKIFTVEAAVKKGFQVMKDSKQDTPDKRVSELVSRYLRDSLTPDQMATLTKLTSFGGSFSREGATFVLQEPSNGAVTKAATGLGLLVSCWLILKKHPRALAGLVLLSSCCRLAFGRQFRSRADALPLGGNLDELDDDDSDEKGLISLLLEEMVQLSLLRKLEAPRSNARYIMHHLIHEFAAAHPSGKTQSRSVAQGRFVTWMMTRVGAELLSLTPNYGEHPDPQKAATLLAAEALNFQQVLKCPLVFSCLNEVFGLGHAFYALGQFVQSAAMWKLVIRRWAMELGAEHPVTILAMGNLASSLGCLGEFTEAIEIEREVLRLQSKTLGVEHPDTLLAMVNLAASHRSLGDYSEAVCITREVLKLETRVFGVEQPSTLVAMAGLAAGLWSLGEYTEAARIGREVLGLRTKILGAEHPDTLSALGNLAAYLRSLGEISEATRIGQKALDLKSRVLGAEHPETLKAMTNLAACFGSQGQHSKAIQLEREVLKLTRRVLGAERPATLIAMTNLATSLHSLRQYSEAAQICKEVLEIRTRVLGAEHHETLRAMANLARCVDSPRTGEYGEAVHVSREVIGLKTVVSGAEHYDAL